MNTPASPSAPKFISFEGTEGVGKTTAIDSFCQHLDALGIAHVRTREPGGSTLAEVLRDIFLDKERHIDADTEILLMFTARSDHLHRVILPALANGKWVICDRFVDSTVAYQGFGRYGGGDEYLSKIDVLTTHFVPRLPDITFWLDIDPIIGMARANKRGSLDRMERQTQDFFERAYQGFVHQHQKHPKRIRRIDADGTPKMVSDRVRQAVFGGGLTA